MFPGSYLRSRLSVLPEEQGTLTRARDSGPQSILIPGHQPSSTLRRKRSQSLADLQMSFNGI